MEGLVPSLNRYVHLSPSALRETEVSRIRAWNGGKWYGWVDWFIRKIVKSDFFQSIFSIMLEKIICKTIVSHEESPTSGSPFGAPFFNKNIVKVFLFIINWDVEWVVVRVK